MYCVYYDFAFVSVCTSISPIIELYPSEHGSRDVRGAGERETADRSLPVRLPARPVAARCRHWAQYHSIRSTRQIGQKIGPDAATTRLPHVERQSKARRAPVEDLRSNRRVVTKTRHRNQHGWGRLRNQTRYTHHQLRRASSFAVDVQARW